MADIYADCEGGNYGRFGGEFAYYDYSRNPVTYEHPNRTIHEGRGICNPGEPKVGAGVVRNEIDGYTFEQSDWFWNDNTKISRNQWNELRTRSIGGRRSRNTLKIEGIINDYSAGDYARELLKFGPIQGIHFDRNTRSGGMSGFGYVHYKYSQDAEKCANQFSIVSRRGRKPRICFARWCNEELDIQKMHEIGGSSGTFTVSIEADDYVIEGGTWASWEKVNFGVAAYRH